MIPVIELIRLSTLFNEGTFGILRIDKEIFCCTLEPAQKGNKVSISSIPTGQYICQRYRSSRYKNTFEVLNVTGRSNILFHAGNIDDNTAGCILLGEHFGKLRGDLAILNSGKTFKNFMKRMDQADQLHLTVSEHY